MADMLGIYSKEEAIQRLKSEKLANQYAFCSEKALAALHFQHAEVI